MKQTLSPTLDDLRLECVLMQAWKKTSSYLRAHSWYADTLELDYQSLRIPAFLAEIQAAIEAYDEWIPDKLELVPAPKTQAWYFDASGDWVPRPDQDYGRKIRPLAHVSLRDQVVATAIMMCLADRVETRMNDPRLSVKTEENRRRVLAYGHRLVCDEGGKDRLQHRWGSTKLYRQYYQDYQSFLRRPREVAKNAQQESPMNEIAIIHSDLSKFYDRVSPRLLQQQIFKLKAVDDDSRFYDLARRVFNWHWADEERAKRHAREHRLAGFMEVALPQGLVAAGFFANVVMYDFETTLRHAIGQEISNEIEIKLLDAAYYVDDLRLVVQIPRTEKGIEEGILQDAVVEWLQDHLDMTADGLEVERNKTTATILGRDKRFLVPQSLAAQRIQSDTSGVFDMLHGTELIGAIEGFFHTQKRYSTETSPEELSRTSMLVGLSDIRDETAARFAAGRFRRTFRSLRPLLHGYTDDSERRSIVDGDEQVDGNSEHGIILTKEQLDERAKFFAALLIEEWTSNPANVRLLRVALDMYPDSEYLDAVLQVLKPGWATGKSKGARREVRLYCLAELFRAGATETGMVPDVECLPSGANVEKYHERLLSEANDIFNQYATGLSSKYRTPWYLLQQVYLYLSARNKIPDILARVGAKGGKKLALYRRFAKCLRGDWPASLDDRAILLIIARTGFNNRNVVDQISQKGVSPEFLTRVEMCSPQTAEALWLASKSLAGEPLIKAAQGLGLEPRPHTDSATYLPEIASQSMNPFFSEPNLLWFAKWLLDQDQELYDKPLTPWQIECRIESSVSVDQFGSVVPEAFRVNKSLHTGEQLFETPKWCDTNEDRRRHQIGALLRYAIRGTNDFVASTVQPMHNKLIRYRRSISHWEQQRYSTFQGRGAFGPPWLPLSSFVEDLLHELLRWPGSANQANTRSMQAIDDAVSRRLIELGSLHGHHSKTTFLEQDAPLLFTPKNNSTHNRPLRIGIVQTVIPDLEDYKKFSNAPHMNDDSNFRRRHRAHIAAALEGVNQMLRVRDTHRNIDKYNQQTLDILVFPELAVHPADVGPLLEPFARKHKCILLFGLVYHAETRLPGSPLINTCQWLIPEWSKTRGFSLRVVEQGKRHLAQSENILTPTPIGFRPAQWLIKYKWSTDHGKQPLTISASICYDATDLTLAADLRSRSDLYIICALNQDVETFDRMSEALHYHMYQGVILVNNGQFGGSSFFMPFQKSYRREIFHFHGQPQVQIAFAEIDPEKLLDRPKGNKDELPSGEFKNPPAGWLTD